MIDNFILSVGIGLAVIFLGVSLLAGILTESIFAVFKLKEALLLVVVKEALGDFDFKDLAFELYQHPLINPCAKQDGSLSWWNRYNKNPAYIEPGQFAATLLEIIHAHSDNPEERVVLKSAVDVRLPRDIGQYKKIRMLLLGMIDRAVGDEEKVRNELENWFRHVVMREFSAKNKRRWQFFRSFLRLLLQRW